MLFLLVVPAVVVAQQAEAGRIAFEQFTLPNGLRVIYSEDRSTPVVSVDVWYQVGSRNERAGRSGFAHLFEHMMFQGSAHVKKAEHFQLVQRAGGSLNGSTQEDRTNYFETIPSNRLNLALWLEADRMRSLAITQENFENQRETVKEERRLGVDNRPYAAAFSDGLAWPYDSTGCFAYAHTVIGSMDDLNAAKLPDVQPSCDASSTRTSPAFPATPPPRRCAVTGGSGRAASGARCTTRRPTSTRPCASTGCRTTGAPIHRRSSSSI